MTRKLAITCFLLLGGCVLVCVLLLQRGATESEAARPQTSVPVQVPEPVRTDQPAPEWEPLAPGESVPSKTSLEETEPPDAVREDEPGWWIWGVVHDPHYRPIPGAKVAIELEIPADNEEDVWPLETVESDAKGRYAVRFENPIGPPGFSSREKLPVELFGRAFAPGYIQPYWHDDDFLVDGGAARIVLRSDFLVIEGWVVHGFVKELDGGPAARAHVLLVDPVSRRNEASAPTDVNGEYFMILGSPGPGTPVPPGNYLLVAARPGEGVSAPVPVEVAAGSSTEAPVLTLQPCGVIAGTVERHAEVWLTAAKK